MSLALDLLSLQALDDEVMAVQASIADVERRLHGDESLNQARRDFAAADEALAAAQKEQRRLDADVQALTAKIAPEEKRLYSGTVTNSKELQNIQHELELLKAQRAKLEDQLLDVLATVETAEAERARTLKAVEAHEVRRSGDVQALRDQSGRLNSSLTSLQARRLGQQSAVDAPTLALYDDLRRRKGGHAVSRIQGSSCSGCRVQLPDAIRRRAMSSTQLAQCPNCERILAVA